MKSLILAAAVAALSISAVAPVLAATVLPGITAQSQDETGRRGRGCDSAHDIKQHPRCTKP
jgi:hypothetical protein